MEIWKDIKGYEGLYQISNMGRVKSLDRITSDGRCIKSKYLKIGDNNKGYKNVALCKNSIYEKCYVHRLVAQAFIPNEEGKKEVDHINTIRDDNRVENLRWVTHKENMNNEISRKQNSNNHWNVSGGNNPKAKKVVCDGVIFNCVRECAEHYNIKPRTMNSWFSNRPMPQKFINMGLSYIEGVA